MSSRLNEMENEGLIVIGRPVGNEWDSAEKIQAVAATVDEWAKKPSVPLGLVYCGTSITTRGLGTHRNRVRKRGRPRASGTRNPVDRSGCANRVW